MSAERVSVGRLQGMMMPAGPCRPTAFCLLVSVGEAGWHMGIDGADSHSPHLKVEAEMFKSKRSSPSSLLTKCEAVGQGFLLIAEGRGLRVRASVHGLHGKKIKTCPRILYHFLAGLCPPFPPLKVQI